MQNVLFNYVVNGIVIEGPMSYASVLERTGLTDTVGLTELGYIEHMPTPEPMVITKEQLDVRTRNIRNSLLQHSDWTQVSDSQLSVEDKAAWATYRQTLRDMPATFATASKPEDITWPSPPGATA